MQNASGKQCLIATSFLVVILVATDVDAKERERERERGGDENKSEKRSHDEERGNQRLLSPARAFTIIRSF